MRSQISSLCWPTVSILTGVHNEELNQMEEERQRMEAEAERQQDYSERQRAVSQ